MQIQWQLVDFSYIFQLPWQPLAINIIDNIIQCGVHYPYSSDNILQ